MKRWILAAAIGFFIFCSYTRATTFLELESTYLGDGWFSYRAKLCSDPFVWQAALGSFDVASTSWTEAGVSPSEWTNSVPTQGSWRYSQTNWWQDRPYERTFYARSSERSWRLATNGSIVTFALWPATINDGQWRYTSMNLVGYAQLPCLVPCSPEQADGSAPSYLHNLKLVSDIQMGPLVVTNDTPFGITYDWRSAGLVELQGSFDLQNWTPITRIHGYGGRTTWTTNTPLTTIGSNFRVQLISGDIFGNALPTKPVVSNLQCKVSGTVATISFDATSDGSYIVHARNLKREIIASTTTTVIAGKGTASFSTAALPGTVTFNAAPN